MHPFSSSGALYRPKLKTMPYNYEHLGLCKLAITVECMDLLKSKPLPAESMTAA